MIDRHSIQYTSMYFVDVNGYQGQKRVSTIVTTVHVRNQFVWTHENESPESPESCSLFALGFYLRGLKKIFAFIFEKVNCLQEKMWQSDGFV